MIPDFPTMDTTKKKPRAEGEDSTQPPSEEEGGELLPPPPKKGCLTKIVDHPDRPPIVSHRHTWTSDALGEGRSLVTTLSNRGLGFSGAIAALKKKQAAFWPLHRTYEVASIESYFGEESTRYS